LAQVYKINDLYKIIKLSFLKLLSNCYRINEKLFNYRLSCVLSKFSSQVQRYSTITEKKEPDNADAPSAQEITENEKKLKIELEVINKEVAELKETKDLLEDKYKRALAEGENIRVRLTKQINDAKLFGIQGFCKDLLDVADVLGKATESVPKNEITEKNPHLKNLYEGLVMTEAQLHKVRYFFLYVEYILHLS
jgi:molecular chaperone GrpE